MAPFPSFLIVVPTEEANHVAVALDWLAWPEVIGTIAGDDTIFLAVKDSVTQRRVLREVRKLARL